MEPEHVPVVVIGAGPTGSSAAIMLGQRGIRCLVLERWPEVYPLPRAVHFDDEVFRIFAGMGLTDEVTAISRPLPGMRLTDPKHRMLAELNRVAATKDASAFVGVPPRSADLAALFHTGGTTSAPKLAAHTHANEATEAARRLAGHRRPRPHRRGRLRLARRPGQGPHHPRRDGVE